MAKTTCPHCGGLISTGAIICKHCNNYTDGRHITDSQKPIQKKTVPRLGYMGWKLIGLAIGLLFIFVFPFIFSVMVSLLNFIVSLFS